MPNLPGLWSSLSLRRRIIVLAATIGMFAAVLGIARLAGATDMALLYAGLDDAAAGEVIAALDAQGIAHEVRAGSIFVDQARRDSLRMTLAAEGLPASGGAGYELLDGLSGFATTSQMFDAAYWRAKEGELARTILAVPQVRNARVHLARAPDQPFRAEGRPTASVLVTSGAGGIDAARARAIRHLVASAVAGMQAADVAVIDSVAGLLPDEAGANLPGTGAEARAAEIRRNVERLLAARVGPGRAVVEVAVELVTESETITERSFDPQGRVAISSETEERTGTSSESAAGVTVASNLPEGDASGGSGQSSSSETRETVNYEVSETRREVLRTPGAIRRLSVAVLVDAPAAEPGADAAPPARSEEELADLRELVASAVGLDEGRGDVLTLKSLAFVAPPDPGELAEPGLLGMLAPVDTTRAIQIAVLGLVSLLLGLFVLRPILAASVRGPAALPAPPLALGGPASAASARALDGEIADGFDLPDLPVIRGTSGEDAPDPVARLRRLIEERQAESVEILRSWMEVEEEKT